MRCPNCGTLVDDGADVCPACHARLGSGPEAPAEDVAWCTSCGSPVPVGLAACPVCGMPVDGAFDDDEERPTGDGARQGALGEKPVATPLLSAIPAPPKDGTDASLEVARPARHRMMLVSALAAVVLVGGLALAITRPWNPHAYDTRATEEADTSMAGFPGEVSHLTSQDFVEGQRHDEGQLLARKAVAAHRDHLGRWAVASRVLFRRLDALLASGDLWDAEEGLREAHALDASLRREAERMEALVVDDEGLEAERSYLVVLDEYLLAETGILANAWTAAAGTTDVADATAAVRSVLSRPVGGHTLGEWHNLFVNAYATGHA